MEANLLAVAIVQLVVNAILVAVTIAYVVATKRIALAAADQVARQGAGNQALEGQLAALKEQQVAAARKSRLEAFLKIVGFMEVVRPQRTAVRALFSLKPDWKKWTDDEKTALDEVCRAFDVLGLLDRNGLVDEDLVDRFYASPLVDLWDKGMGSFVENLREVERRGPTHYWELASLHDRVKTVPPTHPAVTGAPDWPPHPRRQTSRSAAAR